MKTLIATCLEVVSAIQGALGAALLDAQTGVLLGQREEAPGLELAQAAELCAQLVSSKREARRRLGFRDEIEALSVTFEAQLYLIKPSQHNPDLIWLTIVDVATASLSLSMSALCEADRQFAAQIGGLFEAPEIASDVDR